MKTVPNFLIVGTARGGTTSLYYWLKQHPEVFMPEQKEPAHFLKFGVRVIEWEDYVAKFELGAGHKAIGEASTAYLAAPESPEWIAQRLPDVKIIVLLRDPVKRAFSMYRWMAMNGFEWCRTFEGALRQEERRYRHVFFRVRNPLYFWDFMYFRAGCYDGQVRRYLDVFGRESVKICLFSDMVQHPRKFYGEICRFLEIDEGFEPHMAPQNPSRFPLSIRLQFLIGEVDRFTQIHRWKRNRVRKAAERFRTWNVRLGHDAALDPNTAAELRDRYRPSVINTGRLIGRDLSAWLPSAARIEEAGGPRTARMNRERVGARAS